MLPGKCHRDLWEVVHELPDVARLRVFHHAISHMKHYVLQKRDFFNFIFLNEHVVSLR